jgi:hypothetical protein
MHADSVSCINSTGLVAQTEFHKLHVLCFSSKSNLSASPIISPTRICDGNFSYHGNAARDPCHRMPRLAHRRWSSLVRLVRGPGKREARRRKVIAQWPWLHCRLAMVSSPFRPKPLAFAAAVLASLRRIDCSRLLAPGRKRKLFLRSRLCAGFL